MDIKEIRITELDTSRFIQESTAEIARNVGDGHAINALSGGDSAVVTMLGHKALGSKLKTCFIENGIMRTGEAARVIGEVTPDRVRTVREATAIVEQAPSRVRAFQSLAILHQDRVTGMRDGKQEFGMQIEVRSWQSTDAVTGRPTRLPYRLLERIAARITTEVDGVVSVTYNLTPKPSSTIEAI